MIEPTTYDLEDSVRSFVARGSGIDSGKMIPGNSSGPAPNRRLYATLLLIDHAVQGVPRSRLTHVPDTDEIDVLTTSTIRDRYSVQWYREGAMDAARRFSIWTSSPEGLESAATGGFTFLAVGDVRRIDDIITLEFEERASLDLDIGYRERVTTSVNKLEGADIIVSNETHTQRLEIRDAIAA